MVLPGLQSVALTLRWTARILRWTARILRWTARILGILLLLLIAAFVVGEGVPNPFVMPLREQLLSIALLTMVVGLVVAWKFEGVGGLLILGGFAFFTIVNHGIKFNAVFGSILVLGVLNLICGLLRNWKARPVDSATRGA